jgi:hypothetical protein
MIEDAVYSIAKALEKKSRDFGPVTLVVHDGSSKGRVARQRLQDFPSTNAAIENICKNWGSPGFHSPFIMAKDGNLLWEKHELQRECIRRSTAPSALSALANYVRTYAHLFVQDGPSRLGASDRTRRENDIKALADEIDKLAQQAGNGSVQYQQFEEVLGALHTAGFFPQSKLVSDVAFALEGVAS